MGGVKTIVPSITFDIVVGKSIQMVFDVNKCAILVLWPKEIGFCIPQVLIKLGSARELLLVLGIPKHTGYPADAEIIVTVFQGFAAAAVSICLFS